jgi:hypothetical protein
MLDSNIRCGNSLISGDTLELKKYFGDDWYKIKAFNWKDAFRKIMVEEGGFDVVIGNPPWGGEINKSDRNYLAERYPEVADYESSQYFIIRSNSLLSAKGMFGMIIPNTFALNVFAQKCRTKILESAFVYGMFDLSEMDVFMGPNVRSMIILLTRSKIENCRIFESKKNIKDIKIARMVSLKKLKLSETWKEFFVKDTPSYQIVVNLVKNNLVLADYCDVKQGYIPYRMTTLTKRFGRSKAEEIVKKRLWHSSKQKSEEYLRELQGADVRRYSLNWSGTWVRYGKWVSTYLPLSVFSGPRVIIREITGKSLYVLKATYTKETYVHNPSVLAVLPRTDSVSPKFILGLLNSRLMSLMFTHVAPKAKKGLFPKIIITDARRLPFPRIDLSNPECKNNHERVVALVDVILDLNKKIRTAKGSKKDQIQWQTEKTDKEIDDLVYKLYGITEKERKVIEGKV